MSTVFVSRCVQAWCFAFNGAGVNFKVSTSSQANAALNKFVNATALQWLRFGVNFKM